MPHFVKPSLPASSVKEEIKLREQFVLPPAGDDESFPYITAIKISPEEAPFEFYYLGGVDFAKRVLPPEHSMPENDGKHYDYRLLTKTLTEKQAEALRREANNRMKLIPSRPNLDFDPKVDDPSSEYLPEKEVCVGDWLIIEKVEEYNPYAEELQKLKNPEKEAEDEKDVGQKFEESIYKAQGKKNKRGNS